MSSSTTGAVQVLSQEAVDNGQALHATTQTYLCDGPGDLLMQKTVGFTTRVQAALQRGGSDASYAPAFG